MSSKRKLELVEQVLPSASLQNPFNDTGEEHEKQASELFILIRRKRTVTFGGKVRFVVNGLLNAPGGISYSLYHLLGFRSQHALEFWFGMRAYNPSQVHFGSLEEIYPQLQPKFGAFWKNVKNVAFKNSFIRGKDARSHGTLVGPGCKKAVWWSAKTMTMSFHLRLCDVST